MKHMEKESLASLADALTILSLRAFSSSAASSRLRRTRFTAARPRARSSPHMNTKTTKPIASEASTMLTVRFAQPSQPMLVGAAAAPRVYTTPLACCEPPSHAHAPAS